MKVETKNWSWPALAVPLALASAGCQSYQPHPPDLTGHLSAWLDRDIAGVVAPDAPRVEAGERSLTLEEAEVVALCFNTDLVRARARAGVTQATLDTAGLWDDPVLGAGIERMLSSAAHPWMVMTSVGFTLPISGRLEIAKQRAGAAHHAMLHEIAELEWATRMNLRREWINWSAASMKHEVAEEFLRELRQIVGIIDRMLEVGEMASIEGRLFHIEHEQRRNDLRLIDAQLQDRQLMLRQVLGLSPSRFQPRAEPLFVATVNLPQSFDADGSGDVAQVIQRHPTLQTLLARHETAERNLELQIRKQYPDFMLGPGYNYEDGTNRALLNLSVPLPLFNRNRRAIAEAHAERDQARAMLETEYERLLSEYARAEVQFDAAVDRRRQMVESVLPLIEQQFSDARQIAALGEVDTFLLLDTLRRLYEAKLQVIDLQAEESLAAIRIVELLGPANTNGKEPTA